MKRLEVANHVYSALYQPLRIDRGQLTLPLLQRAMVHAPRDRPDMVRHGGSMPAECRTCFLSGPVLAGRAWRSSRPQVVKQAGMGL